MRRRLKRTGDGFEFSGNARGDYPTERHNTEANLDLRVLWVISPWGERTKPLVGSFPLLAGVPLPPGLGLWGFRGVGDINTIGGGTWLHLVVSH